MKFINLVLVIMLSRLSFGAQLIKKTPSEKPKLIVVLVIDQMRFDYLYQFEKNFSDGGFKKLINRGAVCKNAKQNYMFTQRIPGYVTIMSGSEPATHGIISDQWISRTNNQIVKAGIDASTQSIETKGKNLNFSPNHLRTSFFSDELTLSTNGKSKVFSIALDGNVAAMGGGHTAQNAYWFDHGSGNWTTSTYYRDSLPDWVCHFNDKKLPDTYLSKNWTPLSPEIETSKNSTFSIKGFVHDILKVKKITNNYKVLKETPFGNTLTKDFAITAILNDSLGYDNNTDVLLLGFNASGYINEKNGPSSDEIIDTYSRLDKDIEHFISFINDEIGIENTLFILTSDRGTGYSPSYLAKNKIPSGEFDHNKLITLLKSYLNAIYKTKDLILNYNTKQIYLNHQVIEKAKLNLYEIQERIARFVIQFSGIADALPASILETGGFTHGLNYLMQNSYYRQRSGDIFLNLEPGWIELTDKQVLQNSGYNYDTHVPLIWYGWKMQHKTIYRKVNTADIAVTLSELLKIAPPNGATGNIITELLEQ